MRKAKRGTHELALNLAKTYGSPFTLHILNTPCVFINDYNLASSVLSKATMSSRHESFWIELALDGSTDIAFAKYGPEWQSLRFVIQTSVILIL